MKDYKLAVACILLFTLCTEVLSQNFNPEKCCFRYYNKPIPSRSVERILATSPECIKPGFLVITKRRGLSLCVNPDDPAVSKLISKFYFPGAEYP
ncbi:C-C motif chemokine 18-like [Sardina pilchardus]|uniref:C-C motif chemokine 18-like n=1 Tax=Sardina pilchardus TaxID=27697 RepID=UPI002E0DF40E